jgi:hypothetical protein
MMGSRNEYTFLSGKIQYLLTAPTSSTLQVAIAVHLLRAKNSEALTRKTNYIAKYKFTFSRSQEQVKIPVYKNTHLCPVHQPHFCVTFIPSKAFDTWRQNTTKNEPARKGSFLRGLIPKSQIK